MIFVLLRDLDYITFEALIYALFVHIKDLSSSREKKQSSTQGGLECEKSVNEKLESKDVSENGW